MSIVVTEIPVISEAEMEKELDAIFDRYPKEEASLIMVFQDIQDTFNWLPPEAIQRISGELGVSFGKVMSVATFYTTFSLEPRGKKLIKVCAGTACHVRGASIIVEELERILGIPSGSGVTEDGNFSLDTVNCVGACALAPAVVIGETYYANMTSRGISKMLKKEQPK
jgi:NADH-quinone oxidoreductase subunit E